MTTQNHQFVGAILVPVSDRATQLLTKEEWWTSSSSSSLNDDSSSVTATVGAGLLLKRCLRETNWTPEYALKVVKAYRQFMELKRVLEDWDAKILVPSGPVDQMWQMHMLDPVNYCHDCVLLCGRVVGNDLDGRLDDGANEKRVVATKQLLRARYEMEIDDDIWNFGKQQNGLEAETDTKVKAPVLPVEEERDDVSAMVDDEQREEKRDDVVVTTSDNEQQTLDDSLQGDNISVLSSPSTPIQPTNRVSSYGRKFGSKRADGELMHSKDQAEILKIDSKGKATHFPVRVRTLKGHVYHLSVDQGMTIRHVKSMIQKESGPPEDQQHLLFFGKVLEDWKTLGEHNIPPNAGFQLLARSKRADSDPDPSFESRNECLSV